MKNEEQKAKERFLTVLLAYILILISFVNFINWGRFLLS